MCSDRYVTFLTWCHKNLIKFLLCYLLYQITQLTFWNCTSVFLQNNYEVVVFPKSVPPWVMITPYNILQFHVLVSHRLRFPFYYYYFYCRPRMDYITLHRSWWPKTAGVDISHFMQQRNPPRGIGSLSIQLQLIPRMDRKRLHRLKLLTSSHLPIAGYFWNYSTWITVLTANRQK